MFLGAARQGAGMCQLTQEELVLVPPLDIYTLYRYNNFPRFSIEVFGRFVFYIKSTVLVVSTKGYHLLLAYESLGLFIFCYKLTFF